MVALVPNDEESHALQRLREVGADLAGALTGGAITLVAGPFAGAAAGVGVRHALRVVGEEVEERVLAPRQHQRIGAVWLLAHKEISQRLESGEIPRDDGFFRPDERDDASELLEGVLLAAGDAYEERKLPYLARLYASVSFRPDIDAALANFLLRVAERLTYREIQLLALFGDGEARGVLYPIGEEGEDARRIPPSVLAELDHLGTESLLGVGQPGGSVAHFASVIEGGTFLRMQLHRIYPMDVGAILFDVMGLDDFPSRN
jgi:hypothetical protein